MKHLVAYMNKVRSMSDENDIHNIILKAPYDSTLYNNACQVLNHELYFEQFTKCSNNPSSYLLELFNELGGFEEMKRKMIQKSLELFGSGWIWLVLNNGHLEIISEMNGSNPIKWGMIPILGIDVWEHAYYLDYKNDRERYLNCIWKIIDWDVIESRIKNLQINQF
jgi:Fe-Mn family superoxide dismutase